VVSLSNHEGLNYYINSWDVNEMPPTKIGFWRSVEFGFQLPKVHNVSDQMKIYFWQSGTGTLLVDDFRISVYGKR
jgi:oxalate decarboxylase/phosphoglucose isomerase-like protein (cupin superfamily)